MLLFSLIASLAVEATQSDTSYLVITRPKELAALYPQGVTERPAQFGVPPPTSGSKHAGLLMYVATDNADGCESIDITKSSRPWPPLGSPVILLVDRGTCTFVTKVRHAQEVGATAVIVVDNVDSPTLPDMMDDGTGGSITIPSMLIRQQDGMAIKQYLTNLRQDVAVSMGWNLPFPQRQVSWAYFTSSFDRFSVEFKKIFGPVQTLLESTGEVDFIPRFFITSGSENGCVRPPDLPCGNQCTNGGFYCSPDPDGVLSRGASGADIVRENLRQACLWQVVKNESQILWWNYINLFQANCTGTRSYSEACSFEMMAALNINSSMVQLCIAETGGYGDQDGLNDILENELAERESLGIDFCPTIVIDSVRYRGTLQCTEPYVPSTCAVLQEICDGFDVDSFPQLVCDECGLNRQMDLCGVCGDPSTSAFNQSCTGCDGVINSGKKLDRCGVCGGTGNCADSETGSPAPSNNPKSMPVFGVVLIVAGFLAVIGIFVFCYIRRQRARLRNEVNSLMKQYLPMEQRSRAEGEPAADEAGTRQKTGTVKPTDDEELSRNSAGEGAPNYTSPDIPPIKYV